MRYTTFRVNDHITIKCHTFDNRSGWGHIAKLYLDGKDRGQSRAEYQNRTWEEYDYQSVLYQLAEKNRSLTEAERKIIKDFAKTGHNNNSEFHTIAMIAKMGELLTDNQQQSNDWKARMLKAGLENKGLIMPDDWNELSEDEKTKRLDGVINIINE